MPKETELQKAVLDLLAHIPNIYCFRSGSGLIKTERGGYFRSGKKGCPDIVCSIKGKFVGLEIKVSKNKLSEFQKQAQREIENSGGVYAVIRSLDDVENLLATLSTIKI